MTGGDVETGLLDPHKAEITSPPAKRVRNSMYIKVMSEDERASLDIVLAMWRYVITAFDADGDRHVITEFSKDPVEREIYRQYRNVFLNLPKEQSRICIDSFVWAFLSQRFQSRSVEQFLAAVKLNHIAELKQHRLTTIEHFFHCEGLQPSLKKLGASDLEERDGRAKELNLRYNNIEHCLVWFCLYAKPRAYCDMSGLCTIQ